MDIVNETTTYRIVIQFYAEDLSPVTPVSGFYQIDDLLSETNLVPPTLLSISGSTHVLTIPHTVNRLIDQNNDLEERVVTVVAQYGEEKQCTGEYRYKVRNLVHVPVMTDHVVADSGLGADFVPFHSVSS